MSAAVPIIERAVRSDAAALSRIGRQTFTDTFGHLYTAENLEGFLAEAHSPDWYAYALAQPDVAIWVVRDGEGELGAYAVAGPNTLPIETLRIEPGARPGEVKRLYVREGWQGKGLGERLLRTMIDWLGEAGFGPLYVGVYSDNLGAQRLYARHGFRKVGEYIFPVGTHEDREFIFRQEPEEGAA